MADSPIIERDSDALTGQLEAETSLEDCQQQMRLLAQATDDATWDWELITGQVDRNHAAAALFGDNSPIDEPTIEWWKRHIHPDDQTRVISAFEAAIAGSQTTLAIEYRFCKADKGFAYIYDRCAIMRDENGIATRMLGSMIDLTQLEIAKDALARSEATLIHLARQSAMGTMASMIAHELNQPLAAVTNYVRAGRRMAANAEGPAPEALDDTLRAAEENALRAGGIVRRLRELVKRGQVHLHPVAVATLIDDACAIALIDAEFLGVSCSVDIADATPPVLVDAVQIQQVIINLVRNSIDAFERCQIQQICIAALAKDGCVEFSVADTGPGIAPDVALDLFTPQASPKTSGMGIGLSICRTIVEAHGGSIWLARNSPQGIEFRFTLPTEPQDNAVG